MDPGAAFENEEPTTRVPHGPVQRTPVELAWVGPAGEERRRVAEDVTIGSSPDAQVSVSHPTVSRLHARLEHRPDGPWVIDLGSTNGTLVDGLAVSGARLKDGVILTLGDVAIRVRCRPPEDVAIWPHESYGPLVGRSPAMREIFALLDQYARSTATVLVTGETGTGKDVVARALHAASPRASGPFVVVDCGAVPEALIESELFGHAKGAFSGATQRHDGSFGAAHGGTLFLDEIGELPIAAQPKLLRALESRAVRRVGEAEHRPIDVRVVAATHRDLAQMVSVGAFREDLYFRLAVLPLAIPPLRERREDLAPLLAHFRGGGPYEAAVMEAIEARPWLGNARELRNFVERAEAIGPTAALASMPGPQASRRAGSVDLDEPFKDARERVLSHLERSYLEGWLARKRWNVSAVAEAMQLDRSYVHRLMKKHGIDREE